VEPEGDPVLFDAELWNDGVQIDPFPSWFSLNNGYTNKIEVVFTDPPNVDASTPGAATPEFNYHLKVYIWDAYHLASDNTTAEITINLVKNMPPFLNVDSLPAMTSSKIPFAITPYTFPNTMFTDTEGDDILISLSYTPAPYNTWLNFDYTGGIVTVTGTPPSDNNYAVTYTLSFSVSDQYDQPANVYTTTLVIVPNDSPDFLAVADQAKRRPEEISFDLDPLISDPEGLTFTVTVNINSTHVSAFPWISFDTTTNILIFKPETNADAGQHNVEVILDDGISTPTVSTFMATVIRNEYLIALNAIGVKTTIVSNAFNYFIDAMNLFSDPEGEPFTYFYRKSGQSYPPYFMNVNYADSTISGLPLIVDAGTYNMELVGVDDAD